MKKLIAIMATFLLIAGCSDGESHQINPQPQNKIDKPKGPVQSNCQGCKKYDNG